VVGDKLAQRDNLEVFVFRHHGYLLKDAGSFGL
jgi:hypothetical protein